VHIASHPGLIHEASLMARKKAQQNADWNKNVALLLDGYKRAMKEVVE